jgi:hypothetical protein
MVDSSLWTVFIALTAVVILIQTGIFMGFYFLTRKMNRQADHVIDATRNLLGPLQNVVENLQIASQRIAELSSKMPEQLRQFGSWRRRPAA